MDDKDRQLLALFQKEIPLKPRPFEVLGRTVFIDSADLMLRLNRLQEDLQIGRIQAFFDMEKMGYQSHLIAAQAAPEKVEQAAYYISGHPGVIQCVRRKGFFNLWFSMALPFSESLEFHTECLKELGEMSRLLILRTEQVFKPVSAKSEAGEKKPEAFSEFERRLIQMVQADFPLADDPYRRIAKDLGSTEEQVLKQLQSFQKNGLLKKIAAAPVPKEKAETNALVLWDIPEEKAADAGRGIAEFPEVSFCVKRTASIELPYNLHTVLECADEENAQTVIEKIERRIGMWPRQCWMKEKEEKRGRSKYFSRDIEDWRMKHETQSRPLVHPQI